MTKYLEFFKHEYSLWLSILSIPVISWIASNPLAGSAGHFGILTPIILIVVFLIILNCVRSIVTHSDVLGDKLGEPYGTMFLTISAATVEAVMLVNLSLHSEHNHTLTRDTLFSTIFLTFNGLVGICLLLGGLKFGEQQFNFKGAKVYLSSIIILIIFGCMIPSVLPQKMIIPFDYFLIAISVVLYCFFLKMQTGTQSYFFSYSENKAIEKKEALEDGITVEDIIPDSHEATEDNTLYHVVFLLLRVVVIAIQCEFFSVAMEDTLGHFNVPKTVLAVFIAFINLSPELMTAVRAAMRNDMQRVINIACGCVLSTIALTIPIMLIAGAIFHFPITLAFTPVQIILTSMTMLVLFLTGYDGQTNALSGLIQLILFSFLLFLIAFN